MILTSFHQLGETVDGDSKADVVPRRFHGLGEAVDGIHVEYEVVIVKHGPR